MEPAQYQIPLVVSPPRRRPWQRLYLTPTLSSAARAHGSSSNPGHSEAPPPDSLEWTLRSEYDHEKHLFVDKPATLRRHGRDQRLCQEAQARRTALKEAREALMQAGDGQEDGRWERLEGEEQDDDFTCDTWSDSDRSTHGEGVPLRGPRVVRVRTRDSLANALLYSPRPTHTLTVPKASPGYARNPDGAFFTS
ncbi:uncharacterized protein [Panulirus ornatus]|uniref:uncharacterized protein n=1 Tax=Panulirus ornatus TaxID=150431 RepID=UPI003A8B3F8C